MAVNLLPASEQQKRKTYLRNYYTLTGGVVLAAGVIVLAAILLLFDQVYRLNLDAANSQKVQAESQAALYLDVEKKANDLSKQLATLKKASDQSTHWASLMTDLQTFTPPGVSVKSINIDSSGTAGSQKTTVTGSADSRRSAAQFQIALAGSPHFKNVELDTTTQTGGTVDYKISLEVNFDKLNGPVK